MGSLVDDPMTRFLVQIVVIIAACRGLGVIARRLGQPAVIAEIAAGVVLGPSVLGWVAPDVFGALFPAGSLHVVRVLSQLGLVLFIFLIGLELDPRLLRGRARVSLAISQVSIVVPFVLGCGLALALHDDLAPAGVSTAIFAVFLGAATSITAFPVVARILTERRLVRTRVGTVTIACAAIDDVTSWCILAFAVSMARADGVAAAMVTIGLVAGYVAAMLWLVRPLLARLAARVGSAKAMSQNLVALVFLLVVISSWVTEQIGVHVLVGAFLLGVVVPKEGGFARALAEKLEDVVVVILLPLFFALSGLRTEVGFLATTDHLLMCGAILLVATAGKFGGAAIAARVTGLGWREAGAIGVLMNTRGLTELIVANIGLELGVISPALFSMLVITALATTFAAPPLLQWIYPPTAMAHDVVEDAGAAPPASPRGRPVMVCVSDGAAGPALVSMARALGGAAPVIVLHLAPPTERSSARVGDPEDEGAAALEPALARARELGLPVRPLSFVSAHPADEIARVAEARDVEVVLLGMHKPVLNRTLLGGVVREVMQQTDGVVAAYVDRGRPALRRVLVPFQGSRHDRAALALAARIQEAGGAEITVLHVTRAGGERTVESFREVGGPVAVETVEHASPTDAALERAAGYDLVVVGVGAEWGLGARPLGLGLQSERLIEACPTSLLVVRDQPDPAPTTTPARRLAPARIASE